MVLIIQNLVTKYIVTVQHFVKYGMLSEPYNIISTALFLVKAVYCASYPVTSTNEQTVTAAP